jgi:hypothetical protein
MRTRLLFLVAALAAALLIPSAAFAVGTPSITTPAASSVTNVAPVHLVWTDTPDETGYRVFRADADCTGNLTDVTLLQGDLVADTTTYDDTPPADGTYCYYVEAFDIVSSTTSDSTPVLVNYDTTAASGTLTAPLTGPLGHSVAVSATASDTAGGSGVATVEFQSSPAGANTWTTFDTDSTGPAYTGTLDTTTLVNGADYDLRVRVTDAAGNVAASSAVTNLLVDSSLPTVTLTSPVASTAVHGTVLTSANASDVGTGVASVQFQSSPHGAGTWTTYATDTTGPNPYTGSLDTTTLAGGDGLYDVRAVVTDGAGNVNSATVTNVLVDDTPPSGSITSPAASATVRGTVVASASVSDGSGSGVASVQFQSSPHGAGTWTTYATDTTGPSPYTGSLDTTTLAGGDGLYDLRVTMTDVVGNPVATSGVIANVLVDDTAPSGSFTSPASAASVNGTISTTATVTDAGSGVGSVQFQSSPAGANTWTTYATGTGSGPSYSGSLNTTTLGGDGLYDLRVRMSDVIGNPASTAGVTSVMVDNHAPPAPGTPTGLTPVSSAPTITFNAVLDTLSGGVRSGVDHYDIYRDGTPVHTVVETGAPSYTWADAGAPATSPATYTYTVKAVDKVNNVSVASGGLAILLDPSGATAPTSVSASATPTNLHPQISWVAPTGYTVDHYKIYRNGVFQANVPSFPTSFTDSAAPEGSFAYQVRAAADLPEAQPLGVVSASVSVLYDTTPPTAPAGASASAALDGSIGIGWGASSDSGSGVARYVVRRALSSVAPATIADGDAVCQGLFTSCADTTALNGKLYSYAVFAVDAAGNVSAAGTALSITARDQLPPAAPTGLTATPGDTTVALTWAAAGGDVAGYALVVKPGTAAPTSDTDGTRVCGTIVAASTACTATGLTNGASYTFALFALDEALNRSTAAVVTAVPNGKVSDTKAPGAVKGLTAKVSGHTIKLSWKNPSDKDFDHVEITASDRKPAAHTAAKRVYSGTGTKATTKLAAGSSRWYVVVAYDHVGNASAPATVHAAVAAASPFGPPPSAKVHGAVKLSWPVAKGAKYYNVQLYAGTKRILVSWPAGRAVTLPKAKLKRGTKYTWYVWPGLGAKAKAHYGKLIGKNVFTYAG